MTYEVAQGATALLDAGYTDGVGSPADPTTPLVSIYDPSGTLVLAPSTPTTHPAVGSFTLSYSVPGNAATGAWRAHWTGTVSGQPVASDDYFIVVPAGTITFPDSNALWCSASDLPGSVTGDATHAQQLDAIGYATWVLERLSARRYGSATRVLRPYPLLVHAGIGLLPASSTYGSLFGGGGVVGPWAWWPQLPQPALSIPPLAVVTQVKVDGVVETDWSMYDGSMLVRGSSRAWPDYQDLSLPDTEVNTWSVTAVFGRPVSAPAKLACVALASEILKLNDPDSDCCISDRVTSLTRQGVALTLIDPSQFLEKGRTGIYLVDLFLGAANPTGARRRPGLYSPESVGLGARSQ